MAHYAFLDSNNIVVSVIVGKEEDGLNNWEQYYSDLTGLNCKRTSYNTYGNTHKTGGVPFRKNYAGIGFFYDSNIDAFISPQPYPSWTLDYQTGLWNSPIPFPNDEKSYFWNENLQSWIESST